MLNPLKILGNNLVFFFFLDFKHKNENKHELK